MSKARKFKLYVAVNSAGTPIWGSVRANAEICQEFIDQHNPSVGDDGPHFTVHTVTAFLDFE
ncbi:MAG: hypothetical protein AAFS13_10330 [Pseudomonadota bacterium]